MQFNLRFVFAVITFVAVVCALSTSYYFAQILPGLAVLTLFVPCFSWLLVAIARAIRPRIVTWIYRCAAGFTAAVFGCVAMRGIDVLFVAASFMFAIWLPQVMFIAFFEWCEYEHREMCKQETKDQPTS